MHNSLGRPGAWSVPASVIRTIRLSSMSAFAVPRRQGRPKRLSRQTMSQVRWHESVAHQVALDIRVTALSSVN